ncbi:hypothetical protein PHLCEN_2v12138 [Hermanssonia centrifuga]|uniref:Uncharacterized protein n=1 Tax=Hermanssonia centrifuga TaxID=98765 RepID=A0A2R6NI44_9APHY|nr:hypothetical protein PHLCEN_2v12138 [Hermanssonia centrifuga]
MNSRPPRAGPEAYAEWGEGAHQLQDESFRAELAFDLVEVFFQIVHTRLPLLNPIQFRARLQHSLHNLSPYLGEPSRNAGISNNGYLSAQPLEHKPLHNALVATVIAWGAKFSEHPVLVKDRERNNGQSRLAKTLIDRVRDLAEDLKVHRIPSADHVVVALLIEPMQNQNPDEPSGEFGRYHNIAYFAAQYFIS